MQDEMTTPANPRFAVDVNVGRLAKWLRIMGYDATYLPDIDDSDLIRHALDEGRALLTKDARIAERRLVTLGLLTVLIITTDNLWEQIRQVADAFHLDYRASLTRCIECNVPLSAVAREEVRDRVPPYVFRTQEEFMACPSCQRVYWKGTHWQNMQHELERVQGGAR